MDQFRVVVIRPNEPVQNRKKVLRSGLTKAEAQIEKAHWEETFCPEVYFDPVPVVRVELDTRDESSE